MVTCESTRLEAKARLKEYRENQPGCPARIVKKRVPRDETVASFVRCRICNAYINLAFGKDEPAAHQDADGTMDDPRSPGDRDDICDVCDYA